MILLHPHPPSAGWAALIALYYPLLGLASSFPAGQWFLQSIWWEFHGRLGNLPKLPGYFLVQIGWRNREKFDIKYLGVNKKKVNETIPSLAYVFSWAWLQRNTSLFGRNSNTTLRTMHEPHALGYKRSFETSLRPAGPGNYLGPGIPW